MPAPHRTLKHEIALSLAVKLAALAAIGIMLFGPDDRVHPTADTMEARFAEDGR